MNLKWLDLSFNNISKIEGLDTLTKLTDLSLYNNAITVIEGLDNNKLLQCVSLGNNEIKNTDHVSALVAPAASARAVAVLLGSARWLRKADAGSPCAGRLPCSPPLPATALLMGVSHALPLAFPVVSCRLLRVHPLPGCYNLDESPRARAARSCTCAASRC